MFKALGRFFQKITTGLAKTRSVVGDALLTLIGKGRVIGRNGSSGYTTGPHVHFEVWSGPIWDGGRRMNPLNYL